MKTSDAQALARELMNLHGLNGWSFHFDTAVRRFGYCNYDTRTISLSQKLTELNDEARVKNTILHEIAHALVGRGSGKRGRSIHHGPEWVRQAKAIGCDGSRLYDSTIVTKPAHRYEATCPACGYIYKRVRKPKGSRLCGKCLAPLPRFKQTK